MFPPSMTPSYLFLHHTHAECGFDEFVCDKTKNNNYLGQLTVSFGAAMVYAYSVLTSVMV